MQDLLSNILLVSVLVSLPGQAQEQAPETKPDRYRRLYYGFRVEAFPLRLFDTASATSSTTKPIADYSHSVNTNSQKAAPGGVVTFDWTRHISINGELFLHHAKYIRTTTIRSGKKDPNSSKDDRPVTTQIETTRVNYWVIPVFVQYRWTPVYKGSWKQRFFSHAYVSGGIEYRHVGRIRTGTGITNADGTTDYNEYAATASRTNQVGAVLGVGLRFVDDLGIHVTPEVRVIRWQGATFQGPGYRSVPNQAEAGLGFTF